MRRSRFRVDHLAFEHSSVGLRRQMTCCSGVHDVSTDTAASVTTVTFDPDRLHPEDVERLIHQCGYECRRLDDAPDAPVRESRATSL